MIWLNKLLQSCKCKFGLHCWSEVEKESIEISEPHFLFFSWGEQYGKMSCLKCGCIQKVFRSGFVGSGCEEPPWEKIR